MATAELLSGGSAVDSLAPPPRILVADDDQATRQVLCEALTDEGYEVIEASDGPELLERIGDTWLGERPYDLLISDVHMPGCSGLEAVRSLRRDGWATPVLFLSGATDPSIIHEASRCGAELLLKPVRIAALLDRVRRKVRQGRTAVA